MVAAVLLVVLPASLVRDSLAERRRILASPDPAPTLAALAAAGYEVCYANYWQAYQLQFLSEETVRFIPWKWAGMRASTWISRSAAAPPFGVTVSSTSKG